MDVVIVESPAKAKTINKYLGPDFKVLASYGHIRDLPSKDGSVRPDADFAMDWEIDGRSQKHVQEIAAAVKNADRLFLATDPDREGEAISWHVREVLNQKKVLNGVDVKRVVFNEITKSAVLDAFSHPRELDDELVHAYLARRALDYLVGFTLSPVLWRKLPGSRSAGRVQSVALRLICERELEIEKFVSREYWSVAATFKTPSGQNVLAQLTHLNGQKLDKMALAARDDAEAAQRAIEAGTFAVRSVEKKQTRRHPSPPFTTSTLQQEASRKLNFGAKRTMQIAQRLYEGVSIGGETVGLITYMRTDGVTMAGEAIAACRRLIERDHGARYLPSSPRVYKAKAKNAQEAHEAIRPTDVFRHPDSLSRTLDPDQLKLYSLIWKRTLACQMEAAVLDQVAADIATPDGRTVLRATGSHIAFDGFIRIYREGRDDPDQQALAADSENEDERTLPDLKEGDGLARENVSTEQHFTQPPPRFTEASLVKRLEELGIGRPSTYASILSVLQDRNYVRLDKKRFIPEDRGRLVTAFLDSFFRRYVEYDFTADLEERLDDISGGRVDWKTVLREFWEAFIKAVDGTKELRVAHVLDVLDETLGAHFFPPRANGTDPRQCPACSGGRLNLKLGKFGAFIGCSRYPDCRYTRPLAVSNGESEAATEAQTGPKALGTDPATGQAVTLRKGPYGFYVQLGEASTEKGAPKPKRQSVPRGTDPGQVDLERALSLLALPREVGLHPETHESIVAAIGRFGPYLKYQGNYFSLKGDDDVLTIGINRAVTVIAESPKKTPAKTLGDHPDDGKPVIQKKGRFGVYVQHGTVRATLPKGTDADSVTLEQAVQLLAAKGGGKKAKGGTRKAAAKKKAPPRKTAQRKSAKSAAEPDGDAADADGE